MRSVWMEFQSVIFSIKEVKLNWTSQFSNPFHGNWRFLENQKKLLLRKREFFHKFSSVSSMQLITIHTHTQTHTHTHTHTRTHFTGISQGTSGFSFYISHSLSIPLSTSLFSHIHFWPSLAWFSTNQKISLGKFTLDIDLNYIFQSTFSKAVHLRRIIGCFHWWIKWYWFVFILVWSLRYNSAWRTLKLRRSNWIVVYQNKCQSCG
jgi:hypothetical protein